MSSWETARWVSHRTLVPADDANWTQVERGARTQVSPSSSRTRRRMHTSAASRQMTLASLMLAHSLEHTGGYSGGGQAGRGDLAAGHDAARPRAPGCLRGERPPAHRRCGRFQCVHLHEREGDGGRGGPTRRPAPSVPIPRGHTKTGRSIRSALARRSSSAISAERKSTWRRHASTVSRSSAGSAQGRPASAGRSTWA